MGRKKAANNKKGGGNFNIEGPLLSNKLYDENYTGKIQKIRSLYDENLGKTKEELDRITKNLKDMNDAKNDEDMKNLELKKINNTKIIADNKLFQQQSEKVYNVIVNDIAGNFVKNIKDLFTNIGYTLYYSGYIAFFSGEGILFKVIIIIFVIIAFVFIVLGFTGNLPTFNGANISDISKSILMTDNEFMNIDSGSFMSKISKSMYGLVPNEYKYKFNSLSNSLSYISTGKNQFDDFLEPRREITKGRNDNIFHIIKTEEQYNTLCLLKPTAIDIEFPENYYNNIDYYNINEDLRNDIKYPTSLRIDFKTDDKTNKYILNTEGQHYSNLEGVVEKSKIDESKYLFITKNKNIKLNNFINKNYTNTNNIIAMYSTILINKNYKGPIMTINYDNRYRNIYYSNNSLYYKDDNNELILIKTRSDIYYYIHKLFDQSGNGYDYEYNNGNDMDDKYAPILVYKDDNYLIEFYSRSILYLKTPYPNIKSTINLDIRFNTNKGKTYQRGIQWQGNKTMSILKNGNEPLINIKIDNIHDGKYVFNGIYYEFNTIKTLTIEGGAMTLNDLILSSNNDNDMFHGYLYNLTFYTNLYIYTFGIFKTINDNPIMQIKDMNENKDLFINKDGKLYFKNGGTDKFLDKEYYDIIKLYDYNNKTIFFTFKEGIDDRYPPSLVKKDGGYVIRFFRKSLLHLNNEIKDITKIEATIKIETENCDIDPSSTSSYYCKYATEIDNIETYMDILASKKSSIISLNIKDNIYKNPLNYYIINKIDEKNKNNNIYDGNNNASVNIGLDNTSLIECLGSVHDVRSEYNIKMDPLINGNKNVRDDYIKKHAFIGYLSNMTIYKTT